MAKKATTPNPQDATLRNVRAVKRQISDLKLSVTWLNSIVSRLESANVKLEHRVEQLEAYMAMCKG